MARVAGQADAAPRRAALRRCSRSALPSNAPVFDKYIYTLFTPEGTQLVDERGWTDLYICGIDTEVCVLKTAADAFEHNLIPWILKDACASHSGPKAHTAGLLIAARFIGTNQITDTESLPGSVLPLPA
jgi:nicotinamidase-related amidase